MLAAKFYDDTYLNNDMYARIGGIRVEELNALELEFLFFIDFSLVVSQKEFEKYYNALYMHCDSICSSCRMLFYVILPTHLIIHD